ncbi:hypothetical protein [Dysosmobacter sp.]|uniref:hypothetical protein n=1 Tax=Dysosmobacter sp. TaxID=2591382 RepID=UPI002A8EE8EC|nr:hypothetical protein [Dysosmobacter sp.]MDY3986099.1 hypothetical protein [Dysosmobacter sp.]
MQANDAIPVAERRTRMEQRPVKRAVTPRYPTAEDFDKRLLDSPGARRRLGTSAVLCALASLLAGCGSQAYQTDGAPAMSLSMPEADVLAVIREEAEAMGISLEESGETVDVGGAGLTVDLAADDGSFRFSYISDGENYPEAPLETPEGGLFTPVVCQDDASGQDLCVLGGIPEDSYDEETLRSAFRDFVEWLRDSGRL